MLQINELRVGNWIATKMIRGYEQTHKLNVKVCGITRNGEVDITIEGYSQNDIIKADLIYPIPLTKELLLECGFEQDKKILSTYKTIITTYKPSADINVLAYMIDEKVSSMRMVQGKNRNGNMLNIFSLHQYQNFYFAMTGSEMNLNFKL